MNLVLKIFLIFFKIGLFSFGGGYAMLPLFETEIINKAGWLSNSEFIDIIAIAATTPGPVAINSATFLGNKLAGFSGSVIATLGVTLPSFIIMTVIFITMKKFKNSSFLNIAIRGIRPAVLALVVLASVSIGKIAFVDYKSVIIAAAAFFLVEVKKVNPIIVLVLGLIFGIILFR